MEVEICICGKIAPEGKAIKSIFYVGFVEPVYELLDFLLFLCPSCVLFYDPPLFDVFEGLPLRDQAESKRFADLVKICEILVHGVAGSFRL